MSHFNDGAGKLTVDLGSDNVKGRFLQIWNILYPLYVMYNDALESKGLAYEGMVYRKLAESLSVRPVREVLGEVFPDGTRFVFVGLNVLNECEKVLLRKLKDASMAEFCWDWSGKMIQDPQNRSSFFMEDNVREFPQTAEWDKDGLEVPSINVLSVASSVGQAKRIPDILRRFADQQHCGNLAALGSESALVLPDENLLTSVLNSIPEEIQSINVTMGLPMSGSQIYSMMSDIAAIQLHTVCRNGKWYFYHKQVWDLFAGAVFRKAVDSATQDIIAQVRKKAKYYIPQEELCGTPLLDAVFRPVVKDPSAVSLQQIKDFADYLKNAVSTVAPFIAVDMTLALELEYAKEYYRCVNVLQEINLEILPITFVRLLSQLLATVSVPFKGEPLKGLQIMGPLETRALDFRNLVIMSANEGVFPRRSVSSSFVPPELRRASVECCISDSRHTHHALAREYVRTRKKRGCVRECGRGRRLPRHFFHLAALSRKCRMVKRERARDKSTVCRNALPRFKQNYVPDDDILGIRLAKLSCTAHSKTAASVRIADPRKCRGTSHLGNRGNKCRYQNRCGYPQGLNDIYISKRKNCIKNKRADKNTYNGIGKICNKLRKKSLFLFLAYLVISIFFTRCHGLGFRQPAQLQVSVHFFSLNSFLFNYIQKIVLHDSIIFGIIYIQ